MWEASFRATDALLPGFKTNRYLSLLMSNQDLISTALVSSDISDWRAVLPHLTEPGSLISDGSLADLLEFFARYDSVLPASAFELVRDECLAITTVLFQRRVVVTEHDLDQKVRMLLDRIQVKAASGRTLPRRMHIVRYTPSPSCSPWCGQLLITLLRS